MTTNTTIHYLFNNRYRVEITQRGKISVYSLVTANQEKEMKIYSKGNYRYINLTKEKGSVPESYLINDIKAFCLGEQSTLNNVSNDQIKEWFYTDMKDYPLLDEQSIKELPFNNDCYLEQQEYFTRYYKQIFHTLKSNGFMRYHWQVTTKFEHGETVNNLHYYDSIDYSQITIKDINDVSIDELKHIQELINGILNDNI